LHRFYTIPYKATLKPKFYGALLFLKKIQTTQLQQYTNYIIYLIDAVAFKINIITILTEEYVPQNVEI